MKRKGKNMANFELILHLKTTLEENTTSLLLVTLIKGRI